MANGTIAFDTLSTSGQISGTAKSLDTDFVVNGSAKAVLSADSDAVVSESFNIGSGTDHGSGDFSYTVTNAFTNTNYIFTATAKSTQIRITIQNEDRDTASVLGVLTRTDAGSTSNTNHNIAVHGDLA